MNLKEQVLETRKLSNGIIVFVKEQRLKEMGIPMSWFEFGMLHYKENMDPCKYLPKFLNERLSIGLELEDENIVTETLLKIGDWMAGWIWIQNKMRIDHGTR